MSLVASSRYLKLGLQHSALYSYYIGILGLIGTGPISGLHYLPRNSTAYGLLDQQHLTEKLRYW